MEAVATPVGTPLEDAVTQAIGPAGGVIESADGTLTVEIPPGALAAEETVSIQPISNHAHGKIGSAFRLGPENVTFATPVRLTFNYTPEQVLGTSPQLLGVASQTSAGFWELHEAVELDADAGTVSVTAQHFSDWSLVTGAQLSPQSSTVKPGETVSFSVIVCERVQTEDRLAALIAACRPSEVIANLVRDWSVNGKPGGDTRVGTIVTQENRSAIYTAPAVAPQPNTVDVSAQYTGLRGELVLLIADIRIESGICTPAGLGQPCRFDLVELNGKGLPYTDLPRDSWENPESVTAGRLSLSDFDGDGAGTWSLRHVWVESRQSGDLEQFMQLAGDFSSEANGQLSFTVLDGTQFTGAISNDTVTIDGYPLSTKNVSLPVQMKFQAEQ